MHMNIINLFAQKSKKYTIIVITSKKRLLMS